MRQVLLPLLWAAVVFASHGCGTHPACNREGRTAKGAPQSSAVVLPSDFARLEGDAWHGTLTYVDYSTNKPVTIPCSLRVSRAGNDAWNWATGYDDEPHANSDSIVRIIDGGLAINRAGAVERVVTRVATAAGEVRIVTEYEGQDNDLPATIRNEYTISKTQFFVGKRVRPRGQSDYFLRNISVFFARSE
jgi:hypothetical protein